MPPRLDTTYSTLRWSSDDSLVTKTRLPAPDARYRFRNELRVNQLLRGHHPPVATPALVAHDAQQLALTFVAVGGEPLGRKYPQELPDEQLDATIELAQQLRTYNPRRRWFRRFDSARRLVLARRGDLLTDDEAAALLDIASRVHTRHRFGHGDITARNAMRTDDGLVLIDWEWAGLYPDGYDLAFLWFSLIDVDGGRARVEANIAGDRSAFLLSALLIQLWHLLRWSVPAEFREKHLATRDELVTRLCRGLPDR